LSCEGGDVRVPGVVPHVVHMHVGGEHSPHFGAPPLRREARRHHQHGVVRPPPRCCRRVGSAGVGGGSVGERGASHGGPQVVQKHGQPGRKQLLRVRGEVPRKGGGRCQQRPKRE
jgi:hypothetical protein